MDTSAPSLDPGHRPVDQLTFLYALSDQIQHARQVEKVYQEAVERLSSAVGADRTALLVLERGLMRVAAATGLSEGCRASLEGFAPWPADARDAHPVVVRDVTGDGRVGAVRAALEAEGIQSVACVPLLHRGRLVGELLLCRDRPEPLDDAAIRFAEAIASHLALGVWRSGADADQADLLRRFEAERSVLESVVKQMPAGVLVADVPSGRVILSNSRAEKLWGRKLPPANEISDYALWGGLDASGRPLASTDWPLARAVLHGETVRYEEVAIERRDGSRVLVRMSAAPVLDSQGRRLAAVATVEDVTAERAKEARQAFIEEATRLLTASLEVPETLAALGDLVVGRYADWCLIYQCPHPEVLERVHAQHADASNVDRMSALAAGSLSLDSGHGAARAVRDATVVAARDAEEAAAMMWPFEASAIPADLAPTAALTLPLIARGRALGALSVARTRGEYGGVEVSVLEELTDRAAMAMDNALLYEQARTADREKSSFMAVMSHEFRTPLSAILGYADILTAAVHGELNAKQRTHVDRMKASVRHLSHLVDEILSYASMEAGQERIRLDRVDAAALARDVGHIMEPIAEAAGLELRLRLAEGPVEVVTDASKLRQILINLLSNGIKYTGSGHVELVLEPGAEGIRFRVMDTGPGIDAEYAEDIFEPFWQMEAHNGRRVTGTGLGLAVARRLARLMGGDIQLRSAVGEGSEFIVDLPLTGGRGVAEGADG
jgi:signal transduction histidine kinase/PAS domain-containing protein